MNTTIELQSTAQIAVRNGNWLLMVGPRTINPTLLVLTARLAEEGASAAHAAETADGGWSPPRRAPGRCTLRFGDATRKPPRPAVRVVDGGNRFNAYTVARAARGRPEVLNRITVSRAFTCYQVLSLLESTPTIPVSFIVLDLLNTFYDESVQAGERKRLLRACITHLERLAGAATPQLVTSGVVSVHPPAIPSQTAMELLGLLQASAADTYFIQPDAPAPEPMRLF